MQAVILAGGRGKRLRPITDYVPKPLVPIKDIPIIEWQIKYLKKFGIKEIIICTGYKGKAIENFLNIKNNFNLKIKTIIEKTPLGTGGAIKKIIPMIKNDSFIVMNGDVITNISIKKMLKEENTIAIIPLKTKFGIVHTDKNKIIKFEEKKQLSDTWMNAGIYHLSKNIKKYLPTNGDIEKTAFPELATKKKMSFVKFTDSLWHSIDSFKDIEECANEIKKIIK